MPDWLSLRVRFALFFAALGVGGSAVLALGLWLGYSRYGGAPDGYVIAGVVGSLGLLGLSTAVGLLFDENVARPILALSADLHTRATSDVAVEIDANPARYLGTLAPAAQAIHSALEEARESQERSIAEKTARMARDKALLETIVRDLAEGIVVLSPDDRVLLYNEAAVELLGQLGLDRSLSRFVRLDPVHDAAARLAATPESGSEAFLTTCVEDGRVLSGAVSAVATDDETLGHVVILHDATEDLRTHGELDSLLREMVEGARRPAMALGAVLDVFQEAETLTPEDSARFTGMMREELTRLSQRLDEVARRQNRVAAQNWPIRTVAAQNILDALAARHDGALDTERTDARLTCDGFAVTALLDRVLARLREDAGRTGFRLSVAPLENDLAMTLTWDGPAAMQGDLDAWLGDPLDAAYGPYTGRDALLAHRTETWVSDGAAIVLPLAPAGSVGAARLTGHPDFYDFDLPAELGEDPKLGELAFVVFDTETTGLDTVTDEVVQIAAVRIVRGRLVRGEHFDTLVDPGRRIPAASTEIHKITDAMVVGAPDAQTAARDFAAFCEGAVLVAHNAPFDMAFLKRIEAQGGPRFDHAVLCSARLSAAMHDHTGAHTLDALAERFGIDIPEHLRHTALGDAQATAEVFLKMLPVLGAHGVHTLRQAIARQARETLEETREEKVG